ncbi:MAG: hypothetical protein PUB11_03655 [Oscillospiraceae bacterium]|nr:hypothetical protein [Oscillospiraceae bacterium]
MKKILSIILATALFLSFSVTSFAATFQGTEKDGLPIEAASHTVTFSKGAGNAVLTPNEGKTVFENAVTIHYSWDVSTEKGYITVEEPIYSDDLADGDEIPVEVSTFEVAMPSGDAYYPKALYPAGNQGEETTGATVETDSVYVLAYGIKGEIIEYTVKCVTSDGSVLQTVLKQGYKGQKNYVAIPEIEGYEYIGKTSPRIELADEGMSIELEYRVLDKTNHIVNTETVVVPGGRRPAAPGTTEEPGTNIDEEEVPLGPGGNEDENDNPSTDIDDEDVPLGPGGDSSNSITRYVPIGVGVLCGLLLLFLILKKKKEDDSQKNA